MKRFLIYIIIIAIGAFGVYYGLCELNKKKEEPSVMDEEPKAEVEKEKVPSKDDFVTEAKKLQMLAEDKITGDTTCKCYDVKNLDPNTKLKGSILVYTSGDIFVSTMWLSNGYYYIENAEDITAGLLDESNEVASIYCGEENSQTQSRLCDVNY